MKRKRLNALLVAAILAVGMTGCQKKEVVNPPEENKTVRVGLVLTTGGLGDKNFNDMAYAGTFRAQEELGIEFDYVEPTSISEFASMNAMFAESGEYDLVIAISSEQMEAIVETSDEFPDQKISLIDAALEHDNVSSISTKWSEQTFLCGVMAGLTTKSNIEKANEDNVVGIVLGKDTPNLREGMAGFISGVKYVNPEADVLQATVGDFNDPGKAKEIALSMYSRGADCVQHLAGASGLGVFGAAKEADKYAFGVGANQNGEAPDYIMATSIRNVDELVFNEIKAFCDGSWSEGIHISGLKEGAVGYSTESSNVELPEEIIKTIEDIKEKIISGELVPCGDVDVMDEWVKNNQY